MAGGWGKAPQPPARAWGSFLGVKAKPLRGRCASLDPHPLRQCPSSPCAGLWRVFRVKGGSRGWCGPQPRRGEDTPLDATGATQACRQGVGALFPGTPAPRRGPGRVAGRLIGMRCRGTPCLGFKGRAALGAPNTANKNPLPKASIFCSSSFALRLFMAPRRGPKSRDRREPRKATDGGVWASQCNLPRLPCSL